MRLVPIAPVPNQTLSLTIGLVRFVITIKTARNVLVCDVSINGEVVVQGTRILAGEMLLPYRYQEVGNFILTTVGDELPTGAQLGLTQQLYYLTADEMEAIRG